MKEALSSSAIPTGLFDRSKSKSGLAGSIEEFGKSLKEYFAGEKPTEEITEMIKKSLKPHRDWATIMHSDDIDVDDDSPSRDETWPAWIPDTYKGEYIRSYKIIAAPRYSGDKIIFQKAMITTKNYMAEIIYTSNPFEGESVKVTSEKRISGKSRYS